MADENDDIDFTPDSNPAPTSEPAGNPAPDATPAAEPVADANPAGGAPPTTAAPAPVAQPGLADRLRGVGINVENDDQAIAEIALMRDRFIQQQQQLQAWQQQLSPHWDDIQQVIAKKQAPAAPPQNPLDAWRAPPLPQGWEQWYTKDENGKWQRDPNTPLEIVQAVAKHSQWKQDHEKRLNDLPGALKEAGYLTQAEVDARMLQLRDELLQQVNGEFSGRELHKQLESHLAGLKDKFVDKAGKHTPYYHAFQARAKEAEAKGWNQRDVIAYAEQLAEYDVLREEKTLREKQEASRVKAGLPPAVSTGSARVAPIQTNPSVPASETILDAMKLHWGDVEKELFSSTPG